MTLESRPNRILSMKELGVSYEALTNKAFFDIVGRFRNLTFFDSHGFDDLGFFQTTGELLDGKATYDLFVKGSQLPKGKARTLTHEVVHIFWEEDAFGYKNKPAGYHPSYGDEHPPGTEFMQIMGISFMHEDRVEAEAKRFFMADHRMVLDTYRQMCHARGMKV